MTTVTPRRAPSPERRVRLAWQVWLDGAVRRPPLALADGSIVVLDHAERGVSRVRRVDDDGETAWETTLGSLVCAPPVRSEGFLVLPCEGGRIEVLDVSTGVGLGEAIVVDGELIPPVAALGGRIWARFGGAAVHLPRRMIVQRPGVAESRIEMEDPLAGAIDAHFKRTNQTVIATAETADGHVLVVGLDESHARVLWRARVEGTGVSDLWGAGGLVDIVCSDRVMSFDARSGSPLTTRFVGMDLQAARISGETLLVVGKGLNGHTTHLAGSAPAAVSSQRRYHVSTYESANETPRGVCEDVSRVVGAGSDFIAVHLAHGPFALLELPDLEPVPLPEAEALEDAMHAAFSRHRAWIVAHGGQSLSALDVAL